MMSHLRRYSAASMPRYLRQTRLGYLPIGCVIASRVQKGDGDNHLVFDLVMLPERDFQRMKGRVSGLEYAPAPTLTPGGSTFRPSFIIADAQHVVAPGYEPDPEAFAKEHFLRLFGYAPIDALVEPLSFRQVADTLCL